MQNPPPAYQAGEVNKQDAPRTQTCPRHMIHFTVNNEKYEQQTGAVGTSLQPYTPYSQPLLLVLRTSCVLVSRWPQAEQSREMPTTPSSLSLLSREGVVQRERSSISLVSNPFVNEVWRSEGKEVFMLVHTVVIPAVTIARNLMTCYSGT